MNTPGAHGDGGDDGVSREPAPSLSPRVRLEAALLDAHRTTPATAPDERACLIVLVVAGEADLRRYVRECLRDRPDLCLIEAATMTAAVALAARHQPACLVIDGPERDVLAALASHRAVLLVDDLPRDPPALATHLRLLARPFSASELVAEIDRLLG